MYTLDLTEYGRQNVSFYLAIERYILNSIDWIDKELFFIWDIHPAIVCGKHQLIENEVNLDFARSIGVPVYRRHSGGGTIFADEGCFMFTFIKRSQKRDDVFKDCLSEIVDSFSAIGLQTELSGRNDLICKGKKFSGNSYYKNENGSILHGTLLYDTNIEKLVRSITPDNEKLISKGIESVRQRVINVGEYLSLSREELMRHLEHSITKGNIKFNDKQYSEIKLIEKEYLSDNWIWGNNPKYTIRKKRHFDFGTLEANVDVKGGDIKDIKFNGDFFSYQELDALYEVIRGTKYDKNAFYRLLDNGIDIGDYILNCSNEDIIQLLFEDK